MPKSRTTWLALTARTSALLGMLAALAGCTHTDYGRMTRISLNWNAYRRLSCSIDRQYHGPVNGWNVNHARWLHGAEPIPLPDPEWRDWSGWHHDDAECPEGPPPGFGPGGVPAGPPLEVEAAPPPVPAAPDRGPSP